MTRQHLPRPSVRPLLLSLLVASGALFPTLAFTPVQDATVTATWRNADMVVDGSMTDWTSLVRVGTGPAVAVQNDDSSLYLAIASNDPTVRVQLATGLIVWLDGTARRRQAFGLRLEGLAPRPIAGTTPNASANDLSDRVLTPLEEFDLLGPARLQRRLVENAADVGIALASGVEDGTVVYEVKVPLQTTGATPHAVGVTPGATLSVGIETPTDPRPARNRNRLADPMNTRPWLDPWGYGGYFSTPPPPPGGSSRAPREVEFKPMKLLWATVRLAASPQR
jgi:hypothetical protein